MMKNGWLFVSACDDRRLLVYHASGHCLVSAGCLDVADGPRAICVDRLRRLLYLSTQRGPIWICDISHPEAPRPVRMLPTASRMCNLFIHHGNLLGTSYNGGLVQRWQLDAYGLPLEDTSDVLRTAPAAHCVCPGGTLDTVYVPHPDARTLFKLRVDACALTIIRSDPMAYDIRHLKAYGNMYYGVAFKDNALVCLREEKGTLRVTGASSSLRPRFTGSSSGSELRLHPRLPIAYTANRGADDLAVFSISSATPRYLGHILVDAEPTCFALSDDGTVLYTAGKVSGRICADILSPDGISSEFRVALPSGQGILWIEYWGE